ncbi:DUF4249 domain-containing protein [Flavobacterium sp. TAB 87]|uniref:DUF4249 domain-containing protein n=1 Tax=Flavobacterium sp. TAB 87 TaxID=1729581 RepID=UPI00076D96F2|nr:DUF4249 domain-containing protein [Flavobacterium sp. TAB 87]KVV14346.1 hypothetical protein AP058_02238 [Flavobacterium sp. TAB 87]
MKNHIFKKIILLLLLNSIFSSCTETYPLLSNAYEEAIVVEATITNELKNQEIKISKTSKLEEEGIKRETGATVSVTDNQGNVYMFEEQSGGFYTSRLAFKAEPSITYSLNITTADGKTYESSKENLTTENNIESLVSEVITDEMLGRGVQIKVNSYDPNTTSKYYRYEYEETYKIITPKWRAEKLIVTGPQTLGLVKNSTESRICYTTKNSTDIILTKTSDLKEDRVDFQIRFISDQNYILSHRYSVLVKQYVQNLESYTFRKTMKEISSSESILSPKQPGFINGNIKCTSNRDEKAIGFFEVSSMSSKRIFFNYSDLFPGEKTPPYFTNCQEEEYKFCFGFSIPACQGEALIKGINGGTVTYYSNADNTSYQVVPVECGDCTSFSNNEKPAFWID